MSARDAAVDIAAIRAIARSVFDSLTPAQQRAMTRAHTERHGLPSIRVDDHRSTEALRALGLVEDRSRVVTPIGAVVRDAGVHHQARA